MLAPYWVVITHSLSLNISDELDVAMESHKWAMWSLDGFFFFYKKKILVIYVEH